MKNLYKKHKEIINYLIIGVLTTVVNYIVYSVLDLVFKGAIENETARVAVNNIIAWIAAVVFAFFTNKLWVFESRSWEGKLVLKEAVSFVLSRLATGVIDWLLTPLLVSWGLNQTILGITGAWSKLIVSIIVIVLNYVLSKFIVFAKKKKQADGDAEGGNDQK